MAKAATVLLDDRLLIEELLVGLNWGRRRPNVYTTPYWYYCACRAAVAGAGGRLSGPFEQLPPDTQNRAILSLLELSDDVGFADPRLTVPMMAAISRRHPQLNLLNLEAAATALVLTAEVWLAPPSAEGVLVRVLEAEGARWRAVKIG